MSASVNEPIQLDGRLARSARARNAIVEAILDLLNEGELQPGAQRIAARAGVSLRLVFHHFADLEALFGAAADLQTQRLLALLTPIPPEGPLDERLATFVDQRVRLLEAISPVRRAAILI